MKNHKRSPILTLATALTLTFSLCMGILVTEGAHAQSSQLGRRTHSDAAISSPTLNRYAQNLTKLARRGAFDLVEAHESAITPTIQILSSGKQNNPVLIAEEGSEAKAVVQVLARRIATGDVPESLRQTRVYSLNLTTLLDGVKTSAELDARVKFLLAEISTTDGNAVLFVDQLHQFIGQHAAQTVSETLTDATVAGNVRLLGATSSAAYAEYIAGNELLDGLFKQVNLADELAASQKNENENSNADTQANSRGFQGAKISDDLQQIIDSGSSKGHVNVILQVDDVKGGELAELFKQYGIKINARMVHLGAIQAEVPVKALEALIARNDVHHVSLNSEVRAFGHLTATTGADAVRQQTTTSLLGITSSYTLDGSGIGIAVMDSGIDAGHKSFLGTNNASRIVFSKDFTGENRVDDPYGHGTHVAGIAAGNGRISNGKYTGIAANANIINLRVLNKTGTGSAAALLSALDWAYTNRTAYNIRVVNMSLGMLAVDSYKNDPVCRAVRKLVDAGVVVVAASGNNGKGSAGQKLYGRVHSPGIEPSAITVGATNTFGTNGRADDGMATYSSRGPTRGAWRDTAGVKHFDNVIKPDLVAPGNKIVSAESKNNLLVTQQPGLHVSLTNQENRKQMYMNGTSMATPVAAGTAALMLQVNTKLTPNMVKMLMMYTAQQLPGYNMFEQGAGQVNIEGAVRVAKLVRSDLLAATFVGAPLLTTATAPLAKTTIAGQQFTWSQGIIMNRTYAKGTNLVMKYQKVYGLGVLLADGVLLGNGVLIADGVLMSEGVLIADSIKTATGVLLGEGNLLCSVGLLLGDGVLLADGALMNDGVLVGDGVLIGDSVLLSDAYMQAQSATLGGDETSSMEIELDSGVDYLGL